MSITPITAFTVTGTAKKTKPQTETPTSAVCFTSAVMDDTPKRVFSNVDTLHAIGLEAPQGVELVHQLREAMIPIDADVLSEEECIEALIAAIKN